MKLHVLLALLAPLAIAAPARSQTAEEAVAYAFIGLADGASLVRGQTTMSWKEIAGSPATFEADATTAGRKYQIRFVVTAIDDCNYEVAIEGPRNMVRTGKAVYAKIDLRKVTGITVTDHAVKALVAGHGFCETGAMNPTCMELDTSDLFGSVDIDRHKETVAFIRDKVCTEPALVVPPE
jgi:hypothetical protein